MRKYFLVNFFSEAYGHVASVVSGRFSSDAEVISTGWLTLGQNYVHADGRVFEEVSSKLEDISNDESALKLMTVHLDPRKYRTTVRFKGLEELTEQRFTEIDLKIQEDPDQSEYCI